MNESYVPQRSTKPKKKYHKDITKSTTLGDSASPISVLLNQTYTPEEVRVRSPFSDITNLDESISKKRVRQKGTDDLITPSKPNSRSPLSNITNGATSRVKLEGLTIITVKLYSKQTMCTMLEQVMILLKVPMLLTLLCLVMILKIQIVQILIQPHGLWMITLMMLMVKMKLILLSNQTRQPDDATLGGPSSICCKCNARMWKEERVNKNVTKGIPIFSLCCMKGLVKLDLVPPTPRYLKELYEHPQKGPNFRRLIRLYNSMFSFTSNGDNIDHSINRGGAPYVYRLNGQNHHVFGSLIPNV